MLLRTSFGNFKGDSRFSNSRVSAKCCLVLTNHTSMEHLFIPLSDDVYISISKNWPLWLVLWSRVTVDAYITSQVSRGFGSFECQCVQAKITRFVLLPVLFVFDLWTCRKTTLNNTINTCELYIRMTNNVARLWNVSIGLHHWRALHWLWPF